MAISHIFDHFGLYAFYFHWNRNRDGEKSDQTQDQLVSQKDVIHVGVNDQCLSTHFYPGYRSDICFLNINASEGKESCVILQRVWHSRNLKACVQSLTQTGHRGTAFVRTLCAAQGGDYRQLNVSSEETSLTLSSVRSTNVKLHILPNSSSGYELRIWFVC